MLEGRMTESTFGNIESRDAANPCDGPRLSQLLSAAIEVYK